MEMTEEDIQASVSAAFDSVTVIEDASSDADTIARNKEHLTIMLAKDWFSEAISEEQQGLLNTASL
jgi:hypothetical protein|tara:strand:+ start:253 stop:450 length:198 start_codon:yes stop_codon:yes gene_type:complete